MWTMPSVSFSSYHKLRRFSTGISALALLPFVLMDQHTVELTNSSLKLKVDCDMIDAANLDLRGMTHDGDQR